MSSRYSDLPRQTESMKTFIEDTTLTSIGYALDYSIGSFWVDFVTILNNDAYSSATVREFSFMMAFTSSPASWADFAYECIKNDKRPIDVYRKIENTKHILLIELVGRIIGKLNKSQKKEDVFKRLRFPELLVSIGQEFDLSAVDKGIIVNLALTPKNASFLKVKDLDGLNKSPVEKRAIHAAILAAYGFAF